MSRHRIALTIAAGSALLLTLPVTAGDTPQAFKPGPPTKTTFKDPGGVVSAVLTPKGYRALVSIVEGKKTTAWKGDFDWPHTAVVSAKKRRLVFLGGHGNPGVELGFVTIYDFAGTKTHFIDLTKHVKGLKKLSEGYRTICCPFPWVHATRLDKAQAKLSINLCDKKTAVIDLVTGKVDKVR